MPVESFPAVRNPGPPPATSPQSNQTVGSSFDATWAAWIERGRQRDRAVKRKFRIVLLAILVVGLLAALFLGLD